MNMKKKIHYGFVLDTYHIQICNNVFERFGGVRGLPWLLDEQMNNVKAESKAM